MYFRSHRLYSFPKSPVRISRIILISRWLITIGISAFIGLNIYLVAFRVFPKNNLLGQFLYNIHDTIYLPVKGIIYTQIFPWAYIWIFTISAIFLISIISWLFAQSPMRVLYIGWWHNLIKRTTNHGGLLRIIRLFNILSLPTYRPETPRGIAQHEWEKSRLKLSELNQVNSRRQTQIVLRYLAMLKLTVQIELLMPKKYFIQYVQYRRPDVPQKWSQRLDVSFQRWHLTFMLLQANSAIETSIYKSAICDCWDLLLPKHDEFNQITGTVRMPSEIAPQTILDKLQELLSLLDIQPYETIQPTQKGRMSVQYLKTLTHLTEWIESCEDLFDRQIKYLQRSDAVDVLPNQRDLQIAYPVLGQLAIQIAVHVAIITQNTYCATRLINLVHTLQLLLDADDSQTLNDWSALVSYTTNAPIGEIFYPNEIYTILGDINLFNINAHKDEAKNSLLTSDNTWNWESFLKVAIPHHHAITEGR